LTPLNLPHSEQYLPFNPLLSPPLEGAGEVQGWGRSKEETNNYEIKLCLLLNWSPCWISRCIVTRQNYWSTGKQLTRCLKIAFAGSG